MFDKYNIGIMGSGNIAGVMAETIKKMKNVKLYAVASRTRVKAEAFAGKYGCKKAYVVPSPMLLKWLQVVSRLHLL